MLWYRAGSADETPGKSGLAHFFEHLMFKGTTNYPEDTYSRLISRVGGELNAFTSYDYTAYYATVHTDSTVARSPWDGPCSQGEPGLTNGGS
jgi:zinc protease